MRAIAIYRTGMTFLFLTLRELYRLQILHKAQRVIAQSAICSLPNLSSREWFKPGGIRESFIREHPLLGEPEIRYNQMVLTATRTLQEAGLAATPQMMMDVYGMELNPRRGIPLLPTVSGEVWCLSRLCFMSSPFPESIEVRYEIMKSVDPLKWPIRSDFIGGIETKVYQSMRMP